MKTPKGIRVGPGMIMTPAKVEALRALAGFGPRGSVGLAGVMDGGRLAALVQFGLADRGGHDREGAGIYIVNAAGVAFLEEHGR